MYKKNGYVVIDIDENLEDGFDYWVEGEGVLPALTPLWTDMYKGNYTCLYLIWLHFESKYQEFLDGDEDDAEYADEVLEPPLPPGIKTESSALAEFMEFWGISPDLLSAAAEASPEPINISAADMEEQIRQLPDKEKTAFLTRLLLDEPVAVQMDLQKRLLQTATNTATSKAPPRRNMEEIMDAQGKHADQRIAENKRLATEKRLKELKALEKRQPDAWRAVRENLAKRTGSGYEHAVNDLKDLRDLAVHLNQKSTFDKEMADILEEFGKSKAFLERLKNAGIV